jgi:glycerate dehydrogenase
VIMKGVFLDRASLDCADLDFCALEETLPEWEFHDETSPQQLLTRIERAEVVVSNKVVLDADLLRQAARLRLICVAATGTNNVDLETARKLGIPVCNVRRYATPSVVEHVFSMILALTRQLENYHHAAVDGRWADSKQFCLLDFPVWELSGKTMGIVGYGELGQAVAGVAQAFGMEVLVAQRAGGNEAGTERVPLAELLPRVDVLSLHCPLTEQTRNLIGATELALMQPHALLINTARGGIVEEGALRDALQRGTIGGAGIDVLTKEPPRGGNPLLDRAVPGLIVTPHVAWGSRESRQRLLDEIVKNIESWKRGTLRNPV